MFAFGCWAGIKMFLHEKGACQNDMRTVFFTILWFSLMDRYRTHCFDGPVPEFLRLVHGKELPVPKGWNSRLPTWEPQVTIARNCRFPEVGTPGSQPGNHGLPLQATAGYHCKQLPVPTWEPQVTIAKNLRFLKVGTDGSQRGNQRLPWQGTAGSQTLKTYGSQPGNQRLLLPGIAGSQKLEFMFSKLIGYHCKELRVPKA